MDEYFRINQKKLLKIANTKTGRQLLHIPKNVKKVLAITPESYHWNLKGKIYQGNFFTSNWVAEKLVPILDRMEILKDYYAEDPRRLAKPEPLVFLTSANFLDDTGEGKAIANNKVSWAASHDAASADSATSPVALRTSLTGGNYFNSRVFLPFTLTSIAGGTISAAILKLYRDDIDQTYANADTTSVVCVQSNEQSVTSLATSDYNKPGTTSGGSTTLATWSSNNAYQNITLNATAIGWMTPGNHAPLSIITALDRTNSAPSGDNSISFNRRNDANPPLLTLTYTLPAGAAMMAILI